ncbi:hypothetical protein [Streptomyces sp. cmx-4-9]|uniref:hypothetical protein n=1 Tax=Streptomyces sp. cmx-4-9 TaxID=2790941 RepID=UPI003980821C
MADARHDPGRACAGPPLRLLGLLAPDAAGPRLLAQTWAAVTRRTRRRPLAGPGAVCAGACEHRSYPGRKGGRPRREETASPGGALHRERAAHGTVASRTTGPDDLAALLDMLDLRPGPDGNSHRRGDAGPGGRSGA